jgi:hypothetical protein
VKKRSLNKKCLELQFKADIEENNIWLAASLAYFFSVLYVILTAQLGVYVESVLLLVGVFLFYYFHVQRARIKQAVDNSFF